MAPILTTLFLAAVAVVTLPSGLRPWIVIVAALVSLFLGLTLTTASRIPLLEFLTAALLPVVLGLAAMIAGYRDVNRQLMSSASAGRLTYETGRRQARLPAYLGAGASGVILAAAMIRRRGRQPEPE